MLITDLAFFEVALRFSNCCITTSYCIEPRDGHSDSLVGPTLSEMCCWRQSRQLSPVKSGECSRHPERSGRSARTFP